MVSATVPFTTPDGRFTGWKSVIPGGRPLATPAVADGRVFLGGGFGSHEFYALDAATGDLAWEHRTHDDGPTAAAVEDGLVVFNTESCELEVLTVEGKPVWKKWLGDPLMSMPAIAGGRVFMAFPDSRGDRRHYLACFDLRAGREHWRSHIAGEIITAPVCADGQVYLSTMEGTVYCFRQDDGGLVWQEPSSATSSPVVWNGRCYFSRRDEVTVTEEGGAVKQQVESLAARGLTMRDVLCGMPGTATHADWLDYTKRGPRSPYERDSRHYDAHVGFAFSKGDAKMDQAMRNTGRGTVHGCWAYQGSKPFIFKDRLYSAMGDTLKCVDPRTQAVLWKKALHQRPEQAEVLDSVLTPPALVNDKVFVGSILGDVHCLSAEDGEVLWSARIGEPIVFQPAVARGRVYAATYQGSLVCLETGDAADDGWFMWGAAAAHNGLPAEVAVAQSPAA
jgi:Ca-activated chloride channel family protein